MTNEVLELLLHRNATLTENALRTYYTDDADLQVLLDAERYSLFAGGKRIRPTLVLEFCKLFGGDEAAALPFACAIEMIHTYSLIHDDLPCMDNDELRRGKPTNHMVYGYANALLAGDALLTKAFETISENKLASPEQNCRAVSQLARAAGAAGMIGGQILDLEGEKKELSFDTLKRLQTLKTGELITCASLLGCIAGGADEGLCSAAREYSMAIGRAFQVEDDILDVVGTEETLGKPIGSDKKSSKTTFLSFMTIESAREYAARLTENAIRSIEAFDGGERLASIARALLSRNN